MKRTISAMRGKGSLTHNRRDFIAENVDSSRTPLNIEYRNEDIRAVYHELFDDALAHYNEKQTRRDRVIDDYYEKMDRELTWLAHMRDEGVRRIAARTVGLSPEAQQKVVETVDELRRVERLEA